MSPIAVANGHHGRRKVQPASAPARSSRKAEVTSVFANWNCRGLAGVVRAPANHPAECRSIASFRQPSTMRCRADLHADQAMR